MREVPQTFGLTVQVEVMCWTTEPLGVYFYAKIFVLMSGSKIWPDTSLNWKSVLKDMLEEEFGIDSD